MNGMVLPGLAPSTYKEVEQFYLNSTFAKKRFDEASEVIGYSLSEAFKKSKEIDYAVKECAFLTVTVALMDHYNKDFHIDPNFIIGPSFGGMATAVKTQSLSYSEAIWLTHESAKIAEDFYQELDDLYQTIFIYNLSIEKACNIIKEFQFKNLYLELVGHLGKVVSLCGPVKSVNRLKEKINNQHKVVTLHTMQQPIHSQLLTKLKEKVKRDVYSQVIFKPLKNEVISDVDGTLVRDPEGFSQMLLDGFDHPVRWELVTKRMKKMNLPTIYVVGPKNLFYQLLKKQWKTIEINPDSVFKTIKEIQ